MESQSSASLLSLVSRVTVGIFTGGMDIAKPSSMGLSRHTTKKVQDGLESLIWVEFQRIYEARLSSSTSVGVAEVLRENGAFSR